LSKWKGRLTQIANEELEEFSLNCGKSLEVASLKRYNYIKKTGFIKPLET